MSNQPVMMAVGDLKPHPKNSRTHSPGQITALGRAMRELGFLQPLVADEDGVVLIGHGRLEAAKSIGLKKVPVIVRAGMSDAKKRALLISDNRLAETGSSWDQGVLTEELSYLLQVNYDLTLTGFDLPELTPEKDAPEAKGQPATVTQEGDVWLMQRHRLACGPLGADSAPRLMVTEPKPGEALQALLAAPCVHVVYLWHPAAMLIETEEALAAAGFEIRGQIVGIGETPAGKGSGDYKRAHDLAWYAVRKGESATWEGGRKQTTVWTLGPDRFGRPIDCYRRPILNHTEAGAAVFDPFAGMGKGGGLLAAHQAGRIFRGVDTDPELCDLVVKRWQAYTGLEATHETTGQTFAERQAAA